MRYLRWFTAVAVLLGYSFHVWAQRPDTEATARNLALDQVRDSNAPVEAFAHLQQAQTLGWLVVTVVVFVLLFPEIVRAWKALLASVR